MLATLLSRRAKLREELGNIERQVYDMETSYLQDPGQCGNVLKGFEGFLSSSNKNTALYGMPALTLFPFMFFLYLSAYLSSKRSRKFQPEDRLFSLSSVASPAAEEIATARDGEPVICRCINTFPFLMFIACYYCCCCCCVRVLAGKPKKGRGREAKKMRHFSEPDYDYDDDPDVTL
ncbi:hypothetical protein CXB51_017638 [Gossypium anomalum]|uniref:Chromatin modification-related protein MEAF6 n=1 Tax=Gossypium anomalum TaxID=47600 RepID=A0A8J5ZJC4_9ROSI|nr:hypothetical protein CXB51_017638 [Gossypium anomalum]